MNIGVITGLVLLVGAFIAAAAEMAAQAHMGTFGFLSAYSTMDALFPARLAQVQDFVGRQISPLVLDFVIRPILVLPGWLILGLPGGIIAWRSRPDYGKDYGEDDDQMPYTTYEDVIAAAERLDLDDIGDRGSKYTEYKDYDPTDVTMLGSLDDYMDEWKPASSETEANLPSPARELSPPDKPNG